MMWNVIARVGPNDDYEPDLDVDAPRLNVGLRRPGDVHALGPDSIATVLSSAGSMPSETACDLLSVAAAAYAADLRIERSLAEDRWTRDIKLLIPVVDRALWTGVGPRLQDFLGFLTGDRWLIEFRERAALDTPSAPKKKTGVASVPDVCLFSGGLDSLVGVVDLLSSGNPLALVGHHGAGLTNPVQQRVLVALRKEFGALMHEFMFYVQPRKDHTAGEPSMRSRSVLFLALGVAVASAHGERSRLVVAENGLISLNVPLTNARIGSSSTRTTHPHVIAELRELLRELGVPVEIDVPYRFHTKGEMLKNTQNPGLLTAITPLTVSCSHPEIGRYQGNSPGTHCGYCVPCIIRRAALNAAGMDHGTYDVDVIGSPPENSSETARDPRAFQMAIERLRNAKQRDLLAAVASTGPLPPTDMDDYGRVFHRGMSEVSQLFGVGPLL